MEHTNTATETEGRPRLLGITDEVTVCDCCGKPDLKRTFAISLDGESEPVYFGSTCGARALRGKGYSLTGRQIETRAEKLVWGLRALDQSRRSLEMIEAMIAAGHIRYVIGGVERGAVLANLVTDYRRDVGIAEKAVEALRVLSA